MNNTTTAPDTTYSLRPWNYEQDHGHVVDVAASDIPEWESWGIFEAETCVESDETGDTYESQLQLQRIDDPDEPGALYWAQDVHAWRYVWAMAMAGSEPHLQALTLLFFDEPIEYNCIASECSNWFAQMWTERGL